MKKSFLFISLFIVAVVSYDDVCEATIEISPNGFVDFVGVKEYVSCYKLTTLVINEGITLIGNQAFHDCTNLVNIQLPTSLSTIKQGAFEHCTKLESISIPEGVSLLEPNAFRTCLSLKYVSLPSTLTAIGICVFQEGMESIISFTFPKENPKYRVSLDKKIIFTVRGELVMGANSLESVDFSSESFGGIQITEFSTHCFAFCKKISVLNIPKSVLTVALRAFYAMHSLRSIVIGPSITNFDTTAFDESTYLEEINVDENSVTYSSVDGVMFSKDKEKLIIYPTSKKETVFTIPKETKYFEMSSFFSTKYLINFDIDSQNSELKVVDGIIFSKSGDTIVKVPPARKSVDLNSLVVGTKIVSIGDNSFITCQISSISIPESVKYIGKHAFRFTALVNIEIPETVEFLGEDVFSHSISGIAIFRCKLKVFPPSTLFLSGVTKVVLPDSIEIISNSSFDSCQRLESINIPSNLRVVEKRAFYYCRVLTDLIFPESLEIISESAFESCIGFKNVTIPKKVLKIGDLAFSTCQNVVLVTFMSCNTLYNEKNTFYSIPNFKKPVCIASKTFTCHQNYSGKMNSIRLFVLMFLFNAE